MEDKPAESGMLRTPVEKSWINYLLNLLTGAGFLSINIVAASISSIRWTHALLRYLEFKVNEAYGACCLGTQVQAHHSLFQNILGHEFQRRYKFDRPLAPIGTKESKKKHAQPTWNTPWFQVVSIALKSPRLIPRFAGRICWPSALIWMSLRLLSCLVMVLEKQDVCWDVAFWCMSITLG